MPHIKSQKDTESHKNVSSLLHYVLGFVTEETAAAQKQVGLDFLQILPLHQQWDLR